MTDYRVGIDIGGTFTDFHIIDDQSGRISNLKISSTPTKPEEAIFNGMEEAFSKFDISPERVKYFIHGTTLAVNTIIQRNGLKTALLVTKGFRDILNIGRHRIPDVFNFFTDVSPPLVPRSDTYEIPERCLSDGTIHQKVDEGAVRQAVRRSSRTVSKQWPSASCTATATAPMKRRRALFSKLRHPASMSRCPRTSGRKCASMNAPWPRS